MVFEVCLNFFLSSGVEEILILDRATYELGSVFFLLGVRMLD